MARIGPRMEEVQSYVLNHPGCTMMRVAQLVGPRGSLKYGYASVHRAIRAGLVVRRRREDKKGCYRLFPAEAA